MFTLKIISCPKNYKYTAFCHFAGTETFSFCFFWHAFCHCSNEKHFFAAAIKSLCLLQDMHGETRKLHRQTEETFYFGSNPPQFSKQFNKQLGTFQHTLQKSQQIFASSCEIAVRSFKSLKEARKYYSCHFMSWCLVILAVSADRS